MSPFISLKERRFGRNGIYWPAFIHLVCLCLFIWGDHWGAYVAGGVIIAALWTASYFDWKALGEIDHDRHDGHTVGICDNCVPICYDGGAPITSIAQWYASTRGHTLNDAQHILSMMDPDHLEMVFDEHSAYMAHPKFKNYPRP